jgi:predicted DNA-binding protein
MNFQNKYLKYKSKYLKLRNKILLGGTTIQEYLLKPGLTKFEKALANFIWEDTSGNPEDDINFDFEIKAVYNRLYTLGEDNSSKRIKIAIINTDMNNLLLKYPDETKINYIKNDIDGVVLVFKTIVIRIFKCDFIYKNNLNELFDLLSLNKSLYLEEICEIYINEGNNLYYVVSNKITAFESNTKLQADKIPQIRDNIKNGLEYLNSRGWYHHDARIDNIGYDTITKTYRLFDFGSSRNKINNDIEMLEGSIEFRSRI